MSSIQLVDKYLAKHQDMLQDDRVNRLLKSAKQNSRRLVRMINNLIDVTKIDAGFFDIDMTNCNIVKICEDICMSVVEYTRNKGVELVFDTDIEECVIACDPNMIERVMLNLLSNAVKFTSPGDGIIVSIKTGKDCIIISVKDTGTGIPEDKLGRVFERFVQANKSLTRMHEGSEIGLSLVKSLIEMHSGTISVKSVYGKGAEFIVRLPLVILGDESSCAVNSTNKQSDSRIERISIEFSDVYT